MPFHEPAARAGQEECALLRDGYKFKSGADSSTMRPKKVILCVDDNEQDLSVLKFMLSTNGYRVLSASNGLEAL